MPHKKRRRQARPAAPPPQRRYQDKDRVYTVRQEPWQHDKLQEFYEWIGQLHVDLESWMFRLQVQQNSLALELLWHHAELGRSEGSHWTQVIHRQIRSGARLNRRGARLLGSWVRLEEEIQWLRHIMRIMGPLYFLSSVSDPQLPENDPVTLFFYELYLIDRDWNRREG